jgi:hypothetical protein
MKFDLNSEYKTGNITINIEGEGGIRVQRSDFFTNNTFEYKLNSSSIGTDKFKITNVRVDIGDQGFAGYQSFTGLEKELIGLNKNINFNVISLNN